MTDAPDNPAELAALYEAIRIAEQLATIATDWNLDEVEIDGEMRSTYALRQMFADMLAARKAKP